jgi:hypothetical protein
MSTRYVKEILQKHSLIIYNNIYYEIECIIEKQYAIRRIESEIKKDSFKYIEHFDCEIRTIPIKEQKNIKKFNKFRESYNKMIDYLNKYKNNSSINYSRLGLSTILELISIKCGITERQLREIQFYLKKTLDRSIEIGKLFKNPFNFIKEDKQLISYNMADKICNTLNISIPFEDKCRKWSYYHIIHKYNSFYVEPKKFYDDFRDLCNKNSKQYDEYIKIIRTSIITKYIDTKPYITTEYLYNFEKKLTKDLIDLYFDNCTNIDSSSVDSCIADFEKYMSIQSQKTYYLDIEQKKAVKNILTNKFSVVTGFPGTGKSSIIQCVLYIIKLINKEDIITINNDDNDSSSIDDSEYTSDDDNEHISINKTDLVTDKIEITADREFIETTSFVNSDVSIMSPTGLAYINIKKKCSYKLDDNSNINLFNPKISGTCHKTLYNTFPHILSKIEKKRKHIYDDDDDDVIYIPKRIIVDEVSMMDIFMFNELIQYCKIFSIHLILVGDHNQLPSIGPGCILNSIIETDKVYNLFSVTNLVKIKRQDEGSLLKNIIKMEMSGLIKEDFVDDSMLFIDISEFINTNNTINREKLYDLIEQHELTKNNCKFLSYFNGENDKSKSHPTNVLELNNILQQKFNEKGGHLYKRAFDNLNFRIGDIIIRTENETTEKGFRANGEHAIIIDYDTDYVYIKYLDNTDIEKISSDKFYNEFKMAYALTVHKSQGSQYKNIIVFIEPNSYVWDKPALYTAVSRAEEKCIIIADYNEFLKVQKNVKNSKKPTLFLKEIEDVCPHYF